MRAPAFTTASASMKQGPSTIGAFFDRAPSGDTQTAPVRVARRKRRRVIAAVHDVAMHLHVFLWRADVDPVALVDVRDEGLLRSMSDGK